MARYDVTDGVVSSGLFLDYDEMHVSSGGTATDTTVDYGGHFHVSSGGLALDTTINSVGKAYVSSGGTAINTMLASACAFHVSSGGLAISTTVKAHAYFCVSSGGLANSITLSSGASMNVSSGGTADVVNVGPHVRFNIHPGGTATQIREYGGYVGVSEGTTVTFVPNSFSGVTLTHNSWCTVHSGTTANNTTIEYGYLRVFSGGTAIDTTIISGLIDIDPGGSASRTTIGSYGAVMLASGTMDVVDLAGTLTNGDGLVNDITLNYGGAFISFGGKVSKIRENGGYVEFYECMIESFVPNVFSGYVYNGAEVWASLHSGTTGTNLSAYDSGNICVYYGGLAQDVTVIGKGYLNIYAGGTADGFTIRSNGYLNIGNTGRITGKMSFQSGAIVSAYNGAIVDFDLRKTTADADALVNDLSFFDPAAAVNYTLTITGTEAFGVYKLAENAAGFDKTITVVNALGEELGTLTADGSWTAVGDRKYTLNLDASGLAVTVNDLVDLTGDLTGSHELPTGIASGVNLTGKMMQRSRLYVFSHGFASMTTINYCGNLIVSSGGVADTTLVNSSGTMDVSSGGVANNTSIFYSGTLYVSGGAASNTTVFSGGSCDVIDGMADATTVSSRGVMRVYSSDAAAYNTTVSSGGWMRVYSGGVASNTTVSSGGGMTVSEGGVAVGVIVSSGGGLIVSDGKLSGRMTFAPGANVDIREGSVIDFDLTQTSPGADVLINDFMFVGSNPSFTLTVDNTLPGGNYKLADMVEVFSKTITVLNTSGATLGTLSVADGTKTIDGVDYTLSLNSNNVLSVTVGGGPATLRFFEGDFNGDLFDTLAVQKDSTVTVYQNGEPWGLGVTLDPGWTVVGTGDFNGDHLSDFLRVNTEGYVVGEMSNGNGTFSPQVLNLKNTGWDILGTGDFNGNGTDDVLIANPTGASSEIGLLGYWESGVSWTLINGYSAEWECVSTGDFNGDGKCDMLWRNSFVGDGGLTYNAYCTWIVENAVDWRMVSVANPAEWDFLCSGDFDGNGSHDIAMINDVGVVGIWGVGDVYLNSWSILSAVTSEWQLAGVADFNADGTDDIAWSNTATGLTGYWQINNKELTTWANIATIG